MSKPKIRVEQIRAVSHGKECTCEGHVIYEVEFPDGDRESFLQPFRFGGSEKCPNHGHCWAATGTLDRLTLTPSYKCTGGFHNSVVHLFLTDGKIQLCSDSTVELAP
jgi:hypothetical protein